MRVQDVEGHLHGVEAETEIVGQVEHVLVDGRALVAGEADEAGEPLVPRLHRCLHRPPGREHPVGVVIVDDLMELQQIDVIGLQPFQRLVELPSRRPPVPAVHLGH